MDTNGNNVKRGEQRSPVAVISNVYAGKKRKSEKSVSIMEVSGEADKNAKTETDSRSILP